MLKEIQPEITKEMQVIENVKIYKKNKPVSWEPEALNAQFKKKLCIPRPATWQTHVILKQKFLSKIAHCWLWFKSNRIHHKKQSW